MKVRATGIFRGLAAISLAQLGMCVLCIGGWLALSVATLQARSEPNILILLSNDSALPANIELLKGLRNSLAADIAWSPRIFDEYLDAVRFPEAERADAMAAFLAEKYDSMHFDLVVTLGPEALRFMIGRRDQLFRGVPTVFASVREETIKGLVLPAGMTGIVSQIDPVKTLELALRLRPDTEHITVISGASEFDRAWDTKARALFAPFAAKLDFTYLSGLATTDLLGRVARLPAKSQIIYLSITGERMRSPGLAALVSEAANAPVYGIYDTHLDHGIVGGFMDTFEAVGRETGEIAHAVLNGTPPRAIAPREAEAHRYIVDWRQIERWQLDANALPMGTEIRFRQPTAWEQYRNEIIAIAAVILLQSVMLLLLATEARRRRRAQRAAEEASERMDAVITGADVGLWNWNAETDAVWMTKRCRVLLGLASDIRLTRANFLALLTPEDRSLALERMANTLRTGKICVSEYRIRLSNGGRRWIMTKTIPKSRLNSSAERLIGVIMDVTERKDREMELEQQRQDLVHLSRVSVVGALSGALAHELNQPLTAILSNAESAQLLARGHGNLKEIRSILRDIIKDNRRAGDVIRHLRSLLRKEQAVRQSFAANDIVTDVLDLCRSDLVLKGVTVTKTLGENLPVLQGDVVQLRQVLLNLIVNASEAMADAIAGERLITIGTATKSKSVEFSVTDQGSGLSARDLNALFQPFHTTKSFGMGLGLAICHWIVTAHGGRISACNNMSGGTTFSFELPFGEEMNEEPIARRVPG